MRTQQLFSLDRPALAGMFMMAIPAAFWLALAIEWLFKEPVLLNSIFVTIDNVSPVLTVLLLVVLPGIALAWNLLAIMGLSFRINDGELGVTITVKTRLINIGVAVSAAVNMGLIGLYILLENFTVTTHWG
jgi:hypothetical protein